MLKRFVNEISFWGDLDEMSDPAVQQPNSIKTKQQPVSQKQRSHQQQKQEVQGREEQEDSARSPNSNSADKSTTSQSADSSSNGPMWRTAVDPHSGRTYYYDAITRKTQWEKPAEIRAKEKREKQAKKEKARAFFREMEANIKIALSRGQIVPGKANITREHLLSVESLEEVVQPNGVTRIRTISSMDDDGRVMQQLKPIVPPINNRATPRPLRDLHGRPPLPGPRLTADMSTMSMELSPELDASAKSTDRKFEGEDGGELMGEALLGDDHTEASAATASVSKLPKPINLNVRRNTGGTVFVKTTMMNPNIDATIKCVCGVYRAHIVNESSKSAGRSPVSVMSNYETDRLKQLSQVFLDYKGRDGMNAKVMIPTLDQIVEFYTEFYRRSQMEHDTIIMSLIYVERLIKDTNGAIAPRENNWMSILFSCMVLASKVWDDLSMWNIDFSNVCGRNYGPGSMQHLRVFTLRRINQLELALLKSLNFNVKAPASTYAKYYFLLRSMLMKSGLLQGEQDDQDAPPLMTEVSTMAPSAAAESRGPTSDLEKPGSRRTKSMDYQAWLANTRSADEQRVQPTPTSTVCLEQLVSMKG